MEIPIQQGGSPSTDHLAKHHSHDNNELWEDPSLPYWSVLNAHAHGSLNSRIIVSQSCHSPSTSESSSSMSTQESGSFSGISEYSSGCKQSIAPHSCDLSFLSPLPKTSTNSVKWNNTDFLGVKGDGGEHDIANTVDFQTSAGDLDDGWTSDSSSWTSTTSLELLTRLRCSPSSDVGSQSTGHCFDGSGGPTTHPFDENESGLQLEAEGSDKEVLFDDSLSNVLKPANFSQLGYLKTHNVAERTQPSPNSSRRGVRSTATPLADQAAHCVRPSPVKSGHSAAAKDTVPSKPLHGYFRFLEQGGSPCYTFFVNDTDEVYFARASKPEKQSNKENCDEWLYTFHSRRDISKAKGAWKGWSKKEAALSNLVGKMSVSNVSPTNARKCDRETQFILFDDRVTQSLAPANAALCTTHDQFIPKSQRPVVEATTPSIHSLRSQEFGQKAKLTSWDGGGSVSQRLMGTNSVAFQSSEASLKHRCSGQATRTDVSRVGLVDVKMKQGLACIPPMELAAIVVSTSVKESKQVSKKEPKPSPRKETVGWGMKFLDKGSESGWGFKFLEKRPEILPCLRESVGFGEVQESPSLSSNHEQASQGELNLAPCNNVDPAEKMKRKDWRRKVKVDVTVVLPAAVHGLPNDGSQGPTPLVDRWQCGGACNCGGWDEGCGLFVLTAEPLMIYGRGARIALTNHDRINWLSPGNSLKIFTQGCQRKKVLGLDIVQAGLFSLRFQQCFSPLQAFATAVAMFHQQVMQS